MSGYTYRKKPIWETRPESVDVMRDALGRKLTAEETAKELSEKFGVQISRNSVIGKATRLGIQIGGSSSLTLLRTPRKAAADKPKRAPIVLAPVDELVPDPVAIPVSRRVSIDELTFNSCRWPLGDPRSEDFAYCGADRVNPHNAFNQYCATHTALAFVPTSRKINLNVRSFASSVRAGVQS